MIMKKEQWIWNVLAAIVAAFCAAFQEYWTENHIPFLNAFAYGICVGVCFSWAAEVVKMIVVKREWSWKDVIIGAIAGVVMALFAAIATTYV